MPDIVRYGVLSTAQIALNRHVPAAAAADNAAVVAIASRSLDKAQAVAEQHGIARAYGSYQELIDDGEIDAIINPLPNHLHCEWTVKAAEAGKHILCEKPLAVSVEQAQEMIDAAAANGVQLMEAFTHRFNPQMQYARRLIQEGEIGQITSARAELTFALKDWENDVRANKELAGGALMDAGCYCVSAIRFALNEEPVRAQAFQRIRQPNGIDAMTSALLQFAGGAVGHVLTSMEQPFRCQLAVVGSYGLVLVPNMFDEQGIVQIVVGGKKREEKFSGVDRFRMQIERFSACVLQDKVPEFSPRDALKNTAVLVAIQRAADTSKTVDV
ncbi:MAG: Gfo/Idh/MocA family protein [Candidatus Latescibacterota bacterium]|jgi:predicted dehydrogenase